MVHRIRKNTIQSVFEEIVGGNSNVRSVHTCKLYVVPSPPGPFDSALNYRAMFGYAGLMFMLERETDLKKMDEDGGDPRHALCGPSCWQNVG
eukprot:SAG31_NODE_2258_length_6069_cov_21.781072_5_plen_92_part_00